MNLKEVVLIGPTPPPLGGVSTHIKRLGLCFDDCAVPYYIVSTTEKKSHGRIIGVGKHKVLGVLRLFSFFKGKLVVVHSSELYGSVVAMFCCMLGAEVVQFFHNGRALARYEKIPFLNFLWGTLLKKLNCVFVVNAEIARLVASISNDVSDVRLLNAFLPPHPSEFVDTAHLNFKPNECIYIGWCGIAVGSRAPIYGLEFFLALIRRCREINSRIVAVVGLGGGVGYADLPVELRTIVDELGDAIVFVTDEVPFVSVMGYLSLFVRPTTTDGDAVSVREGLSLGVHVLASDVIERPVGTISYRFGDMADCVEKVIALTRLAPNAGSLRPSIVSNVSSESKEIHSLDNLLAFIETRQ